MRLVDLSQDIYQGMQVVCLDVSHVEARQDITAEHLDAAQEAHGVSVEPGDILLLHTGTHGRYAGQARYLTDFPGPGETDHRAGRHPTGRVGRRVRGQRALAMLHMPGLCAADIDLSPGMVAP